MRRIFAILVLIERPDLILTVVEERLDDSDLPLSLKRKDRKLPMKAMYSKTTRYRELEHFSAWSQFLLECFDHYRWSLLAPKFSWSDDEDEIPSMRLADRAILPFTSIDKPSTLGGHGSVVRVAIHPGHYYQRSKVWIFPCSSGWEGH
jgi:hypothetical protein